MLREILNRRVLVNQRRRKLSPKPCSKISRYGDSRNRIQSVASEWLSNIKLIRMDACAFGYLGHNPRLNDFAGEGRTSGGCTRLNFAELLIDDADRARDNRRPHGNRPSQAANRKGPEFPPALP